ncbi:MAG: hypothetical protein MZV70_57185 [Desulfobacterales bacterium]|nr:hypothetical protein [Desulfobacterales bacterium]
MVFGLYEGDAKSVPAHGDRFCKAGQVHGPLGYINGFLKVLCHHVGTTAHEEAQDQSYA